VPHLRIEPTGNGPAPVSGVAVLEEKLSGDDRSAGDRDGPGWARIIPLSGPDACDPVTIGRHPDCEVTLDIPTVSRRHAWIRRGGPADGGGYFLEDLGSRNATLLRGEPVRGRMRLHDRDEIVICDVRMRFVACTPPPHAEDDHASEDSVLDSYPALHSQQAPGRGQTGEPNRPSSLADSADGGATLDGGMKVVGAEAAGAAGEPGAAESPLEESDTEEVSKGAAGSGTPGELSALSSPPTTGAGSNDPASAEVWGSRTGALSVPPTGERPATDSDSHYDYQFTDEAAGVLASLPAPTVAGYRLDVNPEAKLRAVLSITRDLAGSDGLDHVLDRTLASLFKAFPQADRGFVMLADAPGKEPIVRATRVRPALGTDDDGAGQVRISRTIVRRVMETGEAILSVDVGGDSRFDSSSSLMDLQLRSVVCIPLHGRGEQAFGALQLDTADPTRQFSEDDLDLLRAVAVPIGLAAENARLTIEAARRREAERDLELAARIQQGFLPQDRPPVDGYEFADQYESAQSVGGDYFDYICLPDGRLAIALGDVAGKGVPAALLMARMSAAARSHLLAAANKKCAALLPSAVRRLNAELTAGPMGHRFITCVVLLLDPKTHTLYAVNAGHMAPLIRTAAGSVEPLGEVSGGMPLGIDGTQTFEVASRTLRPGDGALLFTDGITEAVREGADDRAAAGKELDARARNLYGRERLAALYGRTAGPAAAVIDAVNTDVAAWTGCGPQTDDICVVALRRSVGAAAR